MSRVSPRAWWRQVRHLWERITTERPDDPLPLEWIWGATVLSVAAGVVGWTLAGKDLIVNALGNLVLLGPGLILTNVIARTWRLRRQAALRNVVVSSICFDLMTSLVLPVEEQLAAIHARSTDKNSTLTATPEATGDEAMEFLMS